MRIRCGTCHSSMWIQPHHRGTDKVIVKCGSCSQEYDLTSTLENLDLDDFQHDAREFAQNSGIDLPAAYSVLLGMITLDNVRDLCGPSEPASGPAKFDSSFKKAVEAGWLTAHQAAMRGKRNVFAQRLVERHGLSMSQALRVADNRMPLLDAIRRREPIERIAVKVKRGRRPVFRIAIAAGAILAIAAIVVLVRTPEETATPAARRSAARANRVVASLKSVETELRHNDEGQLTEVTGGDPEAVLNAFCDSVSGRKADAVALEPLGADWTGLYRRDGKLFGVTIRRDPRRNLWVIGNAVDRIDPKPVTNP